MKYRLLIIILIILFNLVYVNSLTYYVDSGNGNDLSDGMSENSPWETIDKINNLNCNNLQGGDSVLFKRGEVWREQLTVPCSGDEGNGIYFGAYGSGDNPLIRLTKKYDNFWRWEYNLFSNGNFEEYTLGNKTDDIHHYGESILNDNNDQNTLIKVDYDNFYHGFKSVRFTNDGTGGIGSSDYVLLNKNIVGLDPSQEYTFSFYGMIDIDSNNMLNVRIKDIDNNLFLHSNGSWVENSATHVIDFNNDSINTWIKKEIQFNPLGNNLQFNIYSFNTGNSWIDKLMFKESDLEITDVILWEGIIDNEHHSYGAMIDDKRLPIIYSYVNIDPIYTLEKNIFYSPSDSNHFYYRNDEESIPSFEIGNQLHGILIENVSNIVVENIDILGPSGLYGQYISDHFHSINIDGNSKNIEIKNLKIGESSAVGIYATFDTENVVYDGVEVSGSLSTGIYHNGNGGSVINSKIYNNGLVETDVGDRGGIGSFRGKDLLISNNEVYSNAREETDADFEISVVEPDGVFIISNNYVHDCDQGCIQFAGGEDNVNGSIVGYNIVDSFSTSSLDDSTSEGKFSGIRIGGGAGPTADSRNVKVYNNLIMNGDTSVGSFKNSGLINRNYDNRNLKVKNNIFFNNDLDISTGIDYLEGTDFDYNLFFSSNKFYWYNSLQNSLSEWNSISGFGENSIEEDPQINFITEDEYTINSNSFLIDSGEENSILNRDIFGNPIYGQTDIGPIEYQPPYDIGINGISINDRIRLYNDGKYRYLNDAAGEEIVLYINNLDTLDNYDFLLDLEVLEISNSIRIELYDLNSNNLYFELRNPISYSNYSVNVSSGDIISENCDLNICDIYNSLNFELRNIDNTNITIELEGLSQLVNLPVEEENDEESSSSGGGGAGSSSQSNIISNFSEEVFNETMDESICESRFKEEEWSVCMNETQFRNVIDLNSCVEIKVQTRKCLENNTEIENKFLNSKLLDLKKISERIFSTELDGSYNELFFLNYKLDVDQFLLVDNASGTEYIGRLVDTEENKFYYSLYVVDVDSSNDVDLFLNGNTHEDFNLIEVFGKEEISISIISLLFILLFFISKMVKRIHS